MKRIVPVFRWIVMIVSFFLCTYGVYLIGIKIKDVEIPVFACPINREGTIEGSCYTLSHLKDYFSRTKMEDALKFFGIFLLCIVLFGRSLCGFICPFGFFQDFVFEIKNLLKVDGMRFKDRLMPMVKLLKWLMLFVFLSICIFNVNFCEICPVVALIPAIAGAKVTLKLSAVIFVLVLVGAFFKRRIWCNVCPLGFLVGLFNKMSIIKLKKNCQTCTECGACYEACPMEIKSIYTEREKKDITTADCIFCMECVNVCPEDKALSVSVLGFSIYKSSRNDECEKCRTVPKGKVKGG